MKNKAQHDADVESIRQAFLRLKAQSTSTPGNTTAGALKADAKGTSAHPSMGINLHNATHLSNTMRVATYKNPGRQLSLEKLDQVVWIDPQRRLAFVEPRVSMYQLAKAALEQGMMVPVIPEFKGITVGGAIMGAALESSSHRMGQFSDICVAYEVLLGDGTLLRATPTEHADLFYGLSGSYGSLGIIVGIELKIEPASPWVGVRYRHFDNVGKAIAMIQTLREAREGTAPHFLEGIVFNRQHCVVIEGNYLSAPQSRPSAWHMSYPWEGWFYSQARHNKDSEQKMHLLDYLFRHDKGAFWIGAYAQHAALLSRYLLEARLGCRTLTQKILGPLNFHQFGLPKDPGSLFRFCVGSWLSSHRLYAWLHAGAEHWVEKAFVVQDFYIPQENTAHFVENALEKIGILPLWLCPISSTTTPQIFSPHYKPGGSPLINVGVYGIPQKGLDTPSSTALMEQLAKELGGKKMLYSHSYYTPSEFWQIYAESDYRRLRQKYRAENAFTSIEDKVLTQN